MGSSHVADIYILVHIRCILKWYWMLIGSWAWPWWTQTCVNYELWPSSHVADIYILVHIKCILKWYWMLNMSLTIMDSDLWELWVMTLFPCGWYLTWPGDCHQQPIRSQNGGQLNQSEVWNPRPTVTPWQRDVSNTGFWLVKSDHMTWILGSDWTRVIDLQYTGDC